MSIVPLFALQKSKRDLPVSQSKKLNLIIKFKLKFLKKIQAV